MTYFESILKVLVDRPGPRRGPARGLRRWAGGLLARRGGDERRRHRPSRPIPALKYLGMALFVFVGWVILTAVLWITRATIIHHTGIDLFPFLPKK